MTGRVHEPGEVAEADLARAAIPWTPEDMEIRRASGYRHLTAPLLKGDLNKVGVYQACSFASHYDTLLWAVL